MLNTGTLKADDTIINKGILKSSGTIETDTLTNEGTLESTGALNATTAIINKNQG